MNNDISNKPSIELLCEILDDLNERDQNLKDLCEILNEKIKILEERVASLEALIH